MDEYDISQPGPEVVVNGSIPVLVLSDLAHVAAAGGDKANNEALPPVPNNYTLSQLFQSHCEAARPLVVTNSLTSIRSLGLQLIPFVADDIFSLPLEGCTEPTLAAFLKRFSNTVALPNRLKVGLSGSSDVSLVYLVEQKWSQLTGRATDTKSPSTESLQVCALRVIASVGIAKYLASRSNHPHVNNVETILSNASAFILQFGTNNKQDSIIFRSVFVCCKMLKVNYHSYFVLF